VTPPRVGVATFAETGGTVRTSIYAALAVGVLLGVPAGSVSAQGSQPSPQPPARKIPGINAEDKAPRACVSCHVKMPELDARLSTAMAQWTVKVEPQLLAKAQAAAPTGVTLKGKHPATPKSLSNIPSACLTCHGRSAKTAPPFGRLLHVIHLTGGEENHFMTRFQGECTHCHKLDRATGQWSLPSGPEK
jgi:hypothetical protein